MRARAPRVGPSAAEEVDGAVAPIDLRAGLPMPAFEYQSEIPHDSTLSNGETGQHVVKFSFCLFCGSSDKDDILIPGYPAPTADTTRVCGQCIERLIDALRAELPRRRLRLAMERLAAGTVSIEMVEQIERMATSVNRAGDADGAVEFGGKR